MKRLVAVFLLSVVTAHGAPPNTMTKVSVVNDTPAPEGIKEEEMPRPEIVIYTAGDLMGRVENGKTPDGKPEGVTIYNDGDVWSYAGATMKGVYERDTDETHSFHATIFPLPAMRSLEFGKEAVFIAKQKVTEGRAAVNGVDCMYREAAVGDLKVRLYSRASDRQPAYVELWRGDEMGMRFKYNSYSTTEAFNKDLFEKPSGVLILNDDATMKVPEGKLSPAGRRWALACGALLNEMNSDRHDLLGGGPRTKENIENWREGLKKWWGVASKEDLLEKLNWLLNEGHREEYIAMGMQLSAVSDEDYAALKQRLSADSKALSKIDLVRKNFDKTGKNTIRAWDYSRYVNVCGWGALVGYITEEEAWELLIPVASRVQQSFSSWDEFGSNFIIGRGFWSGDKDKVQQMQKICDSLIKNPKSPWGTQKWDAELIEKRAEVEKK